MKTFLLFILLCLPALADVGFLQIYNQLNINVTTYTDQKALTNQIPSKSNSSTLMLKTGKYVLKFREGDKLLTSTTINISAGQVKALCLLDLLLKGKTQSTLTVISVIPQKLPNALTVRSLIHGTHNLKVHNKDSPLAYNKPLYFTESIGESLVLNNKNLGNLQPEDNIPHTLLLWSNAENEIFHLLIPHHLISIPENIRDDLTFGRKRDEIKGLKSLKPKP